MRKQSKIAFLYHKIKVFQLQLNQFNKNVAFEDLHCNIIHQEQCEQIANNTKIWDDLTMFTKQKLSNKFSSCAWSVQQA